MYITSRGAKQHGVPITLQLYFSWSKSAAVERRPDGVRFARPSSLVRGCVGAGATAHRSCIASARQSEGQTRPAMWSRSWVGPKQRSRAACCRA